MVVLQVHVNYEFMIEVDPLMSENQVKKSQFCVTSPFLSWLRGRGVTTNVCTLRKQVAEEDIGGGSRSKFMQRVRLKPWITQTTKDIKFGVIRRSPE